MPTIIEEQLNTGDKLTSLEKYKADDIHGVFLLEDTRGGKRLLQIVDGKGFNGKLQLLVSISVDENKILKVDVLEHTETPSYGGYVTEGWFLERFIGKTTDKQLKAAKIAAKAEEEITIITGATVTSEAVINGVNSCFTNYQSIKGEEL
ncbi:FMN-binding protein [Alkaliphilus pronyensis]|uniref:FMN-binding protein n=1 Tax=Alkaliphilus pronyensis TaxID=1482732 RepID=A0A6I0FCK4_9FIRM|nr:FMN-binding protein [Alkaliphilus pronyensis]KAB3531273.1 FMN-binding protein [Alkaliphilus pronyensis]